MRTIQPSRLLRAALFADAAVSAAVAALQLLAGNMLASVSSLPATLLFDSGVLVAAYVALLAVMARSRRLWSWLVLLVVAGNAGWALACAALTALLPVPPNALGVGFLVVHAAGALVFAALEWAGLRSSATASAGLVAVRS